MVRYLRAAIYLGRRGSTRQVRFMVTQDAYTTITILETAIACIGKMMGFPSTQRLSFRRRNSTFLVRGLQQML